MSAMASQITGVSIVYSTVCSGADQRKPQSSVLLAGICEGNSPLTGEFPAQRASNAENASIGWRHHDEAWLKGTAPNSRKSLYMPMFDVDDCIRPLWSAVALITDIVVVKISVIMILLRIILVLVVIYTNAIQWWITANYVQRINLLAPGVVVIIFSW